MLVEVSGTCKHAVAPSDTFFTQVPFFLILVKDAKNENSLPRVKPG